MIKRKGKYLIVLGIIIVVIFGIIYSLFNTTLDTAEEAKEYYQTHPWERYVTYSWGKTYDKMDNINRVISSSKVSIFYSKVGIMFGIAFILGGIVRYAYSKPEEKEIFQPDKYCPSCRKLIPFDANMCPYCGIKFRKGRMKNKEKLEQLEVLEVKKKEE